MDNIEGLEKILNDFLEQTRTIENNILSTMSDTNSDIEMVLRELLVYLNSTSKFLEEIQVKIDEFNAATNELGKIPDKVDTIRSDNSELIDKQTKRIFDALKKVNETNYKILQTTFSYSKKIYQEILANKESNQKQEEMLNNMNYSLSLIKDKIDDTKSSVDQNQTNLMEIINGFMTMSKDKTNKTLNIEQTKAEKEAELKKQKIIMWTKIIGAALGSGGVLYLIIASLIRGVG